MDGEVPRADTLLVSTQGDAVTVTLEVPPVTPSAPSPSVAVPAPAAGPAGPLARTGIEAGWLLALAVTLVVLGALALAVARHRMEKTVA